MALNLILRPATEADSGALEAIENESFPDPNWRAEHFLQYDCTVAEAAGGIAGFVVSRQTFAGARDDPPEREILNLAVAKCFRRLGIASMLLRREVEAGGQVFLEVRESNLAARNLYCTIGFQEVQKRKAYYHNPEESAIVMRMK